MQKTSPSETSKPTRSKRNWRRSALRLAILYCVVAAVLFGCADRLILFPTRQPIAAPASKRIEIAGPSGTLEIFTTRSVAGRQTEPQAFILHFVGNASRAETEGEYVAEQWHDFPVEVWAVNYPGYGKSAGTAKLNSIAGSALAAFDAMKSQAGSKRLFVSGRSIGTTAALHVAAHRSVNGVILHSPPPLRSLILGRFGWWNLWLAACPVALSVPADLDSLSNARKSKAPAVFLLTDADQLVTPPYQKKVFDAYAGTKRAIHLWADHNDDIPEMSFPEMNDAYGWLMRQ